MVLVRGLAATPSGVVPTGTVAVTLMAAVTTRAALIAGDADAAVAIAATGASKATAAVTKMTARWVSLMMSCFLAGQASGCSRPPACTWVTPYVKTPGRMGWMADTTKACPERQPPASLPQLRVPIFRAGHAIYCPCEVREPCSCRYLARLAGTTWGPHVMHLAGQPACGSTSATP